MLRRLVLVGMGLGLFAQRAFADEESTPPPPLPSEHEKDETRYEFSMGFGLGLRDLSRVGFAAEGGPNGAASLVQPFSAAPYSALLTTGPQWNSVVVHKHLRMSIGVQKPFGQFRLADAAGTYTEQGVTHAVSPRSIAFWDLRFGLGAEATFGRVTGYVDMIGDAQYTATALAIDGQPVEFKAWSFGYSVRAGARVQVSEHMFATLAGEVGIVSANRFAGLLMVGWNFGS